MTTGRTRRDLRRLGGEERAGLPTGRPSQPDEPRGSSLRAPLPRASPAPRTAPCPQPPTLLSPALQGARLPPRPPPRPRRSRAPCDPRLGLGLPQCPAPAPSPFAHLPPGTRGPAPFRVGALWAPTSLPLASPAPPSLLRAPEPPRPLVPATPEENLSCPRGQTAFGALPCLGSRPLPGRREAPPHPQVTLRPREALAAGRLPAPLPTRPAAARTPPHPRHTQLGPGRLLASPRLHQCALGGVAASLGGGACWGAGFRAAPEECGTKLSLSGSGALPGWLGWDGGEVAAERTGGVGEGACARH